MQMSDVIGDMLTRIKNASGANIPPLTFRLQNEKAIADILTEEGYIKSSTVIEDGKQDIIRYSEISPGRRKSYPELPHLQAGLPSTRPLQMPRV